MEAIERSDDKLLAVQDLLPALYKRTELWESVATRLKEYDAMDADAGFADALYGVYFYGLCRLSDAAAYRPRCGAVVQMEVSSIDVAEKGNWRKAHLNLQEALTGRADDPENEGYRAQTYVALGLDNEEKAVDSLRRILLKDKADERARELI